MDISYLLWLQQVRLAMGPVAEKFFLGVSKIPGSPLTILIPAFLYWCLDKRSGLFVMFNFSAGRMLNQLVKNTVCCYRPWIRDARVVPAKDALAEATGYSFPSGHTQITTAIYGSLAFLYHRKSRLLATICVILPLLVAFSRNYLGCHTPQDVLMSLGESVFVIWLSAHFFDWMEKKTDRAGLLLTAGLTLIALFMIYITCKPYPMDYQNGLLLVDPIDMEVDCYDSAGYLSALLIGWYVEHRFVKFSTDCSKKEKAVRMLIGFICLEIDNEVLIPFVQSSLNERWGAFAKGFLLYIFMVLVIPALFRFIRIPDKNIFSIANGENGGCGNDCSVIDK